MIKQASVLILISLTIAGCGSKEEVDVNKLSAAIIPFEAFSEEFMDVAEYPDDEEIRKHITKTTEIHMEARRAFLSDTLSREFSPEELHELNNIFSSKLVTRVQRILVSDECLIGSLELAKPELKKLEQNQNMEPTVKTPVE